MMGSSSPAQQSTLEGLLMIVSNPKLLELNLNALKESIEANNEACERFNKAKAYAQAQLATALAAESSLKPKQQQLQSDFARVREQEDNLDRQRQTFEKSVEAAKNELREGRDNLDSAITAHQRNVAALESISEDLKRREQKLVDGVNKLGEAEQILTKRLAEVEEMKAELQEKLDSINAIAGKKK